MDCLEVTLMWSLLMRIALILLSSILLYIKNKTKKNEEEEDIFQTLDSKAISKAVSKEESSL